MRLTLTGAALLLLSLSFAPAAAGQTCACNAPDGTCNNVSVTCSRGCSAICAGKDSCYAACGNFEADLLHVRVTLTVVNGDGKEVSDKLTSESGTAIVFVPRRAKEPFNINLVDSPLYDVLSVLANRGRITVKGEDFRKIQRIHDMMLKDGRLSITFSNVTAQVALDKLSFLSGRSFVVESGDAAAQVNLSLRQATLEEIVAAISKQTGVKVGPERKSAGLR